MSETYEQRMIRLSKLHYLYRDSDFARTSVEEFETWRGECGFDDEKCRDWRLRRAFLEKYFQCIVDRYIQGEISHEKMLQLFLSAATKNDHAILGRFVGQAFSIKPLSKGRFLATPYLKSYANFLKWLKGQWNGSLKGTNLQNQIREDLEKFTGQKISGASLEEWIKPNSSKSE